MYIYIYKDVFVYEHNEQSSAVFFLHVSILDDLPCFCSPRDASFGLNFDNGLV